MDFIFFKILIDVLFLLTKLLYTGSFHQYDGIMHPKVPVKTALKTFASFFGYSSDSEKPVHDVVQQKCLHVYLEPFKQTLLQCSVNDLSKINVEIMHIYFQMVSSKICINSYILPYDAPSVKKVCFTKVSGSVVTLLCHIFSDYERVAVDNGSRTETAFM